ncbi:hypothetical protein J6590_000803 [Homalodisca vitripennis]|nr:hypothetical protein J6590_000803 [Homalodisca vitripennis]
MMLHPTVEYSISILTLSKSSRSFCAVWYFCGRLMTSEQRGIKRSFCRDSQCEVPSVQRDTTSVNALCDPVNIHTEKEGRKHRTLENSRSNPLILRRLSICRYLLKSVREERLEPKR